ncbi:4Fe-4S ferredoxin iron-sulfur binding domain protein [Aminomonas paucivorans DSM 12260]|uniref:4Fe-4S ferredoxin iron-sulfur binding domain protein n=1 Tax=Aminomonas paucivorans DSM 12260 TaxID=584708 RepID=E3D0U0_9BACT|nr:4Fe-4S binding protein [Aminomonas paucivorans]EFQ24828.1 4Fe-4S ferredoxin iron-sulfur binding domain protein [Aminomonas paucivorans DSM 12260]
MALRKIIRIDEDKCDGCGQCAAACHEGAIQMVDGVAKLVSDSYCDGLGDCIGECPRGAISFETREAAGYDAAAVAARKAHGAGETLPCGCPGTLARSLKAPCPGEAPRDPRTSPSSSPVSATLQEEQSASTLSNWPVQLRLVPENAPYLQGAHLLLAADCTAFAHPAFHRDFLPGKVCLVGCPKLDDSGAYREKLARILGTGSVRSLEVVTMEVPCCSGLVRLAQEAVEEARASIPVTFVRVGIDGAVQERRTVEYRFG